MELDRLRADAAALLGDGRAKMVIGFRARGERRVPAFVTDPAGAADLVVDDACTLNPAAYLRKSEVRRLRPVAIVARPAVMRSLVLLAAESQVTDADVVVLAVGPDTYHGILDLAGAAALVREKYADLPREAALLERIEALAAMTADERAAFWTAEFAKCTRCYACRAACPGCYCTRCIVERNTPQWISTAAARHGNYAWNVIRAFHQAGRCTECGACEAACPQGIPLMLLGASIALGVEREFEAKAGCDLEAKPVIGSWAEDDGEEFIR
ncbi:MAG: 4Fe-4S dicluster domain-containing protein [Planctomycetes bacterium]|nr:4Fe-4S dicluster domain-containing protein [Planctomycetota bacterium]